MIENTREVVFFFGEGYYKAAALCSKDDSEAAYDFGRSVQD